jgi:hypothetical protein
MRYEETYSKLSNDEILNLASDIDSLLQPARASLTAELERRRLSATDVAAYKKHLAEIKPGDWIGKEKYVARAFNGFGTAIYGKRDFRLDGSFVTTKWVVFFWIPLFPIRSMRLKALGDTRMAFPMGSSTQYQIYSEGKPHWKQVLYVYAVVLLLFVVTLGGIRFFSDAILLSLYLAVFGAVWLIRKIAKAKYFPPAVHPDEL